MAPGALLALVGLALVDSTSVGTLVLPLLMLVHPRVSASRVLIYLTTISLFYLAFGVALLTGADLLGDLAADLSGTPGADHLQLATGIGLLLVSFWPDTAWAKRAAARRKAEGAPPRAQTWADAIATSEGKVSTVIGVALVAGLIEAASMVPYLGAVALISTSDLGPGGRLGVLAGYVMVMALPALLLLLVRLSLHQRAEPTLRRLSAWLAARAGGAVWWVIGIIGFLLAADAATRIF
ncbi:hypothetical protein BJF80_10760 [Serinicoccus sp. CUA-874]|uniref:GAP family protein n=1 Tax=Serinicoccus sp. CUA-874 TaxID=1517939 RepID=UPI00095B242B|nr:GAP family protein [Serinicoccus sp. CUA-874]OLT15331.1 hypothetical protein BJF80_10760 [Serinicoccus sp. CUA-874]